MLKEVFFFFFPSFPNNLGGKLAYKDNRFLGKEQTYMQKKILIYIKFYQKKLTKGIKIP